MAVSLSHSVRCACGLAALTLLICSATLSGQSNEASTAQNNGPFRPGTDGVGYPACAYCPEPAYTKEAKKAKLEGSVRLQGVIGTDGRASNLTVTDGLSLGLTEKAIEAVQHWRFKPALGPKGKPVAVIAPIEVYFCLPR